MNLRAILIKSNFVNQVSRILFIQFKLPAFSRIKMDPSTVASGFLHDVVEDTPVTLADLEEVLAVKLPC